MRSVKLGALGTVLLPLCRMDLILYVDRVNISTAAPLTKADLRLSNTDLGLAFSAFAYPYAFFQLVGEWLVDRLGARATLRICGLSYALPRPRRASSVGLPRHIGSPGSATL